MPASDDHPLDMRIAPHDHLSRTRSPAAHRDRCWLPRETANHANGRAAPTGTRTHRYPPSTAQARSAARTPPATPSAWSPRRRHQGQTLRSIPASASRAGGHPGAARPLTPRRADRRQGAENGIHETLSQRPELLDQPRQAAPAPGRRLQRGDRRLELMMQRNRGPVLERVRHDRVGPDRPKPLGLEPSSRIAGDATVIGLKPAQ